MSIYHQAAAESGTDHTGHQTGLIHDAVALTHGHWMPVLVGGAVVVGALYGIGTRHREEKGKPAAKGSPANAFIEDTFEGLAVVTKRVCTLCWRFLTGKEMRGKARTNASFWRPGTVSTDPLSTAELGAIALPAADATAGPAIDWDRLSKRLSDMARMPPWVARAVAAAGRGLSATWAAVRTVGRGLGRWHHWRYAGRSAARVGGLTTAAGLILEPAWTILALAAAVPVTLVTAGAWGKGYQATDAETYGPGLWASLTQVLRLGQEDQERGQDYWLSIPDDLSAESARITIRVPLHWSGTEGERSLMAQAIQAKVPGEWVASYHLAGRSPYAQWSPKPAPRPMPQLPTQVAWKSSGTAHKVYVGKTIEGYEIVDQFVFTQTATPHWGVAGDTGSGKSTVLYMAVVHARQHGGLVDILDTKVNSMAEAFGQSGVRIHTTTRACIGAFAEFLVSILAAEQAVQEGADPKLRDELTPRTLVVDELPTLIRFAYTWWKHGIKQKGAPPFIDWFTIILMMGRSSNHRVVVGSQQFDNALFGGTIGRKQIGTKIVVGKQDMVSWGVAFGQNAPRLSYDTEIPGRGAYADKRMDPEGGDYAYVREFQPAYITPEVRELLAACEKAPQWFDDGEMAPWITPEALAEAQETAATTEFMPGGDFAPKVPT
ncbi:type IV secretory system conjugative DNA transfer family protein, partial [Streptomyces sp. NPDC056682]